MSEYMIARTSWLRDMEGLCDSERGRLFTALLMYAASGEMQEPRGSERIVFKKMCTDVQMMCKDVQMSSVCINNNSNNLTNQVSTRGTNNTQTFFNKFWESYPSKVNKKRCMDLWKKIKPDEELLNKMLQSIEAWKRTSQWKRGYIPYPDTWLRGERWNDEIPPETREKFNPALEYEQTRISHDDFNALVVDLTRE